MLASLNHPSIAQIYGVEEWALIMELVEGEMLHGPLPIETALESARQIAEALEDHEKGFIHRDLNPSNIKMTPEGRAKAWISGWRKRLQARARPTLSGRNLLALAVFLIENPLLN